MLLKFQNKHLLILLIVLNIIAWSAVFYYSQTSDMEVCFLDVGQGDSILIQTGFNQQILIDGGPDDSVIGKLEGYLPFWDRTIDLIVLTHPDKDHLFGLNEVLKNYKVKNILWTGVISETLLYNEWLELIEDEGANIYIAKEGMKIGAIEVIYPFDDLSGRELSDINDSSIVLKMGDDILFTGDLSTKIESLLKDIDVDILKLGHHGSKTSTSFELLQNTSPDIAIVSAGLGNSYGHPSDEVLARLDEFAINVLQTSKLKDICLIQNKSEHFYLLNPTE
jgi:competence protein ComEC